MASERNGSIRLNASRKGSAMDTNKIAALVRQVLVEIGEDPHREGLLKTPERVAAAYEFLTSGYRTDPERLLNGAVFTQQTNSMPTGSRTRRI